MSKVLENKIDFVALISVKNANPNGDPLNGNIPRVDYAGYGEIQDVCIKRKIRNRAQDLGEKIFVQSTERSLDGYGSLCDRARSVIKDKCAPDVYAKKACKTWYDVRTFGQVFAYKNDDRSSVSVSVRGPVSVHTAVSCSPVEIKSSQITKCVNGETREDGGKDSSTMGMKHCVAFGLYRLKGSVNVQMAEKTGFTEEDAETLKEAIRTLFMNDASAARPDGSMNVVKFYWWKHNNKLGQYSAAKVHDLVKVRLKDGVVIPVSADDYDITVDTLPDLKMEEVELF